MSKHIKQLEKALEAARERHRAFKSHLYEIVSFLDQKFGCKHEIISPTLGKLTIRRKPSGLVLDNLDVITVEVDEIFDTPDNLMQVDFLCHTKDKEVVNYARSKIEEFGKALENMRIIASPWWKSP